MRDLNDASETFRQLLEPGERLLWHSQPGARGLFLSVLPRLLRDLVFLALVVAALALAWRGQVAAQNLAIVALLGVVLLYSLFREIREATAARISHYLITDRRLIIILPRMKMGTRSITRGRREEPYDSAGLPALSIAGPAASGRSHEGRATLTVPVRGYVPVPSGTGASVERYRTFPLKLIAVADPEAALAALRPSTRT